MSCCQCRQQRAGQVCWDQCIFRSIWRWEYGAGAPELALAFSRSHNNLSKQGLADISAGRNLCPTEQCSVSTSRKHSTCSSKICTWMWQLCFDPFLINHHQSNHPELLLPPPTAVMPHNNLARTVPADPDRLREALACQGQFWGMKSNNDPPPNLPTYRATHPPTPEVTQTSTALEALTSPHPCELMLLLVALSLD